MQSRLRRTINNPQKMLIPPGPALTAAAESRNGNTDQWIDELTRRCLYGKPSPVVMQVEANNITEPVTIVPGHLWGEIASFWESFNDDQASPLLGPVPADVMVLGKWLDEEESVCNRHMAGEAGEKLRAMLVEAGLSGFDKWYITSLIKYAPPQGIDRIPASWLRDAGYLLNQELRIVKPKYLLCLGADAARSVLGRTKEGKVQKVGVGQLSGEVVDYQIPGTKHEMKVMVIPHPRALLRAKVDADTRTTIAQLQRFNHLITGRWGEGEENLDHFGCYTLEQAEEFLDQARKELKESGETRVAWDAEWHGRRPVNKDAYLRTIQLTWREKQAVTFVLRRQGGVPCFVDQHGRPAEKRLFKLLTKFGLEYGAIGHFLVSDLEWLDHFGVKITPSFNVPREGFRPWDKIKEGRTGWCTGMAAHAIEETAPLGLDSLAIRYTSAPRYDLAIEDWIQDHCKRTGIKRANLNGFGECPDEKLVGIVGPDGRLKKSYTCYDTDVTFRIYKRQQELLSKEYFGLDCWQPFWEAMLIQPVLLECHRTGLRLDMGKFTNLTKKFVKSRDRIAEEIRAAANWPDMNINSVEQIREYLFGEHLNGKKLKPGELFKRLRPPGATTLGLTPVLTTDKPPRAWSDVVAADEVHKVRAGTGKTSLALLRFNVPDFKEQIQRIIDYRRIGQMTKSFLRPPQDEEDGSPAAGWDVDIPLSGEAGAVGFLPVHVDQFTFDKGIAASLDDDGRIRTHLSPTTDTGRWRSWDPNLQNACCTGDHQVLTKRGWIPFPELLDTDYVAQAVPGGEISFVIPTRVIRDSYDGKVYRIKTKDQVDIEVTPNHRIPTRARLRVKEDAWKDDYPSTIKGDRLYPQAGHYAGGNVSYSDAEIQFLAAVQADGSYVAEGGIVFFFKKQRKINRLREILNEVCPDFTEGEASAEGYWRFYVGRNSNAYLLAKRLMPDKKFGPWILDLNRHCLDVLANEVFEWDGLSTRKTEYSSSEKQNADWIQILWSLSGWRARIREYDNGSENARTHYCVNTTSPKRRVGYSMTTNLEVGERTYTGTVYCVEVPTGYFVVRKDGKVSITGNSKRYDKEYSRLLANIDLRDGSKPGYCYPIRSLFDAGEFDGVPWVIIESDFAGAELMMMAAMSGDLTMIDHASRACLPDGHPNQYDIHSTVTVMAFKLNCPASKAGLASIGKKDLRDMAKTIMFGMAYGRSAKAIAMTAKEQNVDLTVDEAQAVIDAIFTLYPKLVPFYAEAKRRAVEERWISSCFGRRRRFPVAMSRTAGAEFGRKGMNFPIQSGVGGCLNRGVANLYWALESWKDQLGGWRPAKIALTVHDSVVLVAHPAYVDALASPDGLIKQQMCDSVPIYPTDLSGKPLGTGPYYLGIETKVYEQWGVGISKARCQELGIPECYGKA